jgi:hypothetical protein
MRGKGVGMRTTTMRHLRSVGFEAVDADGHVLVQTPEHEIIDFEGCSAEELDAKLHDFEAWAS